MRITRWRELKDRLLAAGFRPRSSLGQNFLMTPPILRSMVQKAGILPGDKVLEIGVGAGSLTSFLLDAGAEVLGVEIDERLARIAEDNCDFARSRLNLLKMDALDKGKILSPELGEAIRSFAGARRYKLVANLPYSISTPIFCELMKTPMRPVAAVVLVQEDFAQRVCAPSGTHEFSPISVFSSVFGEAKIVRRVQPGEFWPVPGVTSAVLAWRENEAPPRFIDEDFFFDLVNTMFRYRRKNIANALKNARKAGWQADVDVEALLVSAGINPRFRAEQLDPSQFISLYALALKASANTV
ncbi:MAG: 16S rRNA (adenine(1518)-N(6)/adenine(1519)-N(6))-dimethyltransferase RsmA [Candidatus Brocadiia bacterium]